MKNMNKVISSILISSMLLTPVSTFALTKDETIYANLNYDGKVEKATVNNHLSNLEKGTITDDTELQKILNINGKEKYTLENGIISWNSKGKDIYYQGTSTKTLPITVNAKYYLNGKEIKAKDLVGKKGKITIKLNLTNNSYNNYYKQYTPFVVTIGTTLNNKNNSNITITNGKVTSTGNKSMLVAIATPGLYESIGLEQLKDLNSIEINYTTTNFSLNNIYLVTTPKLLSESDLAVFDKMDNLSYSINTLQDSMNKVVLGANDLKVGTEKLAVGANTLVSKYELIYNGIENLKNGTVDLTNGIEKIIGTLEDIKKQLEEEQTTPEALASAKALQDLQKSNANMLNKLKQAFNNDQAEILKAKQAAAKCNLGTETDEQKLALCLIQEGLNEQQISALPYLLLIENNSNAITTLNTKLSASVSTINTMIATLEEALADAKKGSSDLTAGLDTLTAGVNLIEEKTKELGIGLNTALTGTTTLANGLEQINSEGINKLSSTTKTLNYYSSRVKSLVKLSKEYNGYQTSSATNSTFIYKMKALTK